MKKYTHTGIVEDFLCTERVKMTRFVGDNGEVMWRAKDNDLFDKNGYSIFEGSLASLDVKSIRIRK